MPFCSIPMPLFYSPRLFKNSSVVYSQWAHKNAKAFLASSAVFRYAILCTMPFLICCSFLKAHKSAAVCMGLWEC